MCGIAGFLDIAFRNPGEHLHATARRMGETLSHRGPDDAGTWADAPAGIALAHRRLSILDVSPAGHQPMLSMSGRYVIVFNGEIYNFHELKKDLEGSSKAPLRFRGHSDTEVLLACFDSWTVERTLSRVNGMFAFALWDRQERTLYLGRDRLGEKPLYYGWMGDVFVFGSELKALRAHPAFVAEINRDALALFLRHNCIPAPHSIYRGVQKLLPGTFLAVDGSKLSDPAPVPFWSLRQIAESGMADPFRGLEREALEQLDMLLRDAVRIRMVSDVPLGAFLSGGVDSSLVTSLMQAESTRRIKTFSIGFDDKQYDETEDAARVAQYLGTEHTGLHVTPREAMAVIPRLPAIYDEPFADSSQIPTFLLSQMARRHVTVGLSGDGGDEVFCGYTRHVSSQQVWRFTRAVPKPFRRTLAAALSSVPPEGWNSLFKILDPFLPTSMSHRLPGQKMHKLSLLMKLENLESVYLALASQWSDPAAVVIGGQEPPAPVTAPGAQANLQQFIERMVFLDTVACLPDDILTKVDRASMAVSLEARIPLLDHRVVEFAWRLPMSMKLRGQRGKWILRELLHRYVPRQLVERPKAGFSIPLDRWLCGPLRNWAESLLAERRIREDGFFKVQPVREKWSEHLSGKRAWQHQLWGVLMFQAWLDENHQSLTGGSGEYNFSEGAAAGLPDAELVRKNP
jgi:asparagine synthase (glutamine-hydrolysing)